MSSNGAVTRPHIVVVGGGFGGIHAVRKLTRLPVDITLVDRRNFHLFQPLTYQVATGALSPGDIAYPLRSLFKDDHNVKVLLAEVTNIDLDAKSIELMHGEEQSRSPLSYDYLIVAAGSKYSYFGHDDWRQYAAEVKSLESATMIRSQILKAFELAELETDPAKREALMTFVVVGGGPTGVEMAGQIGELARDTLRHDFRTIDPRGARVLLVEGLDRLLGTFPESLSRKAEDNLRDLGVQCMFGKMVVGIDAGGVDLGAKDQPNERIDAHTVIWAAGVAAVSIGGVIGRACGADVDRGGRPLVEADLTMPGHPEVMALGDMVRVKDKKGEVQALPGVAPVAIQQGKYAGKAIATRLAGRTPKPFRYFDKGNVATIGRGKAVVDLGFLRLSGVLAWLTWAVIHIWYLIGFRNRLLVSIQWNLSYLTRGRSARLIVDPARQLAERAGTYTKPAPKD